jgi:hypothetical protein
MTVQEWLNQLLSRPATEPLNWETFSVTMSDPTWKALWRDIDAEQAYDDGVEVGLRLLQATQHHRVRLGERGYQANQILSFVRRDDGGFGLPPLPYGVQPPQTVAVHFLYPQVHRKTVIERKLAQERAGKRAAECRPVAAGALAAEEIQARLAQIREPVG